MGWPPGHARSRVQVGSDDQFDHFPQELGGEGANNWFVATADWIC